MLTIQLARCRSMAPNSVFVSHRGADGAIAERLARGLEAAGLVVFFDEWAIDLGDSIVERMNQGLTDASHLVLCCGPSGFADAPWIDREWMSALARQLNGDGITIMLAVFEGGEPPPILADIKYADLRDDFDAGLATLVSAILRARAR